MPFRRRAAESRGTGRRRATPAPTPPLRRALGLTALSALVPGSGHLASGRRVAGALILAGFVAFLIVVGVLAATTSQDRLIELVFSPDELELLMILGTVVGLVWVFVVYRSWVLTRPRHLTVIQKLVG